MGFWSRFRAGFPVAVGGEPNDSERTPTGSASNPIEYGSQSDNRAPAFWAWRHDTTARAFTDGISNLSYVGAPPERITRQFRPNVRTYFAGGRQFGWLQSDSSKLLPPMSGRNRSVTRAAVAQPPAPSADRAYIPGVYVPFGGTN